MWHDGAIALLGGLVGTILALSIPIVAIIGWSMYATQRTRLQQELLMKLAETGQPIPPELFQSELFRGRRSSESPLRRGLIVTAVGIGVMLYGWILGDIFFLAAGVIPLVVGLVLLLAVAIERRQAKAPAASNTTNDPS